MGASNQPISNQAGEHSVTRKVFVPAGSAAVQPAAVEAVMALPNLVLQALAHALDYLKPFGLEAVLRLGANFRPFHTAEEMHLSPNALRYVWETRTRALRYGCGLGQELLHRMWEGTQMLWGTAVD